MSTPRIGALDKIMHEVSHDIKLPKMHKMIEGNNDHDAELQKGIKCEMQDHGMNEVDAKRTAEEELAKDPEFYSKQEGAEGSAQEESMETPGEEYAEGPEEQASEEEMGTEKPIRHLSVSDLGRSHLKPEEKRPRGNPNFKKRY